MKSSLVAVRKRRRGKASPPKSVESFRNPRVGLLRNMQQTVTCVESYRGANYPENPVW